MKRIELIIIEKKGIDDILDILKSNVGSVYFNVSPKTLSYVRDTLTKCNYTTRLFVIQNDNSILYYIYGKKQKSFGVFNEHCKNSLIRTPNYIEKMIETSSNVTDLIMSDDPVIIQKSTQINRVAELL